MSELLKYPRTRHVVGSRRQPGDEDLSDAPLSDLAAGDLVVEEKLDGANAAVSFAGDGSLLLQSRGHFLTGGPREKHFAVFKTWAATQRPRLFELLGTRYIAFGEWLLAKHTIFYDRLPHYFLEFDVFDRETGRFLSTTRRRALLAGSPLTSVPVLAEGAAPKLSALRALVGPSLYRSEEWRTALRAAANEAGVDPQRAFLVTDRDAHSEGLYLKVEDEDQVIGRYKFVRASFLTSVVDSGSHWLDRPIVRNALSPGVDIFGDVP